MSRAGNDAGHHARRLTSAHAAAQSSKGTLTTTPGTARPIRLSPAALDDVRSILLRSEERFGRDAALRYRALLLAAVRDLQADAARPGSRARPELHPDARTYHLALSRKKAPGEPVKSPRHFILYRGTRASLEIARVLHDGSDLPRHRPEEWADEPGNELTEGN